MYNCLGRQQTYDFIIEKIPDLKNYYEFLYDDEIKIDFDHSHPLLMKFEKIQVYVAVNYFIHDKV